MTPEQAKNIILEHELLRAYHMVKFLHGCLTDPKYSYQYPEQTTEFLQKCEEIIKIPETCFHSRHEEDCPSCQDRMQRHLKLQKALSTHKPPS